MSRNLAARTASTMNKRIIFSIRRCSSSSRIVSSIAPTPFYSYNNNRKIGSRHCRIFSSITPTPSSLERSEETKNYNNNGSGFIEKIQVHSTQKKKQYQRPNDQLVENTENYLSVKYSELVQSGRISYDEQQVKAIEELDPLRCELLQPQSSLPLVSSANGIFSKMWSALNSSTGNGSFDGLTAFSSIKGVYLHGGVGCGKTFCMDLFFHSIPTSVHGNSSPNSIDHSAHNINNSNNHASLSKQKVHFHKFMLDIHQQMHSLKMVDKIEGDVLPAVVDRILQRGKLICFDEFQVTDVADALILRRLFTGLLQKGAIMVATSNRPPQDLYLNGIQRDLFLPFIDLLAQSNNVVSMWESDTDYRLQMGQTKRATDTYFYGPDSKLQFNRTFHHMVRGMRTDFAPTTVTTSQNRIVNVPCATVRDAAHTHLSHSHSRLAKFSFDHLCRTPMGAADYIAIAETFPTVFVHSVPRLSMAELNLVRRFIVFVDSMYECRVRLIVQAETTPDHIFKVDLDNNVHDEAFAFDRTRSRLEEMRSEEYLNDIVQNESSS